MTTLSTRAAATALAAAALLIAVATAPVSAGPTLVVTRNDDPTPGACDPGDCSLREAIIAANEAAGPDLIELDAGSYTLSIPSTGTLDFDAETGDIEIRDDLTIAGAPNASASNGNGPLTTIDANGIDRAFEVITDDANVPVTVELTGLRITGGANTSNGGGVLANGGFSLADVHLTLTDTLIELNEANSGGGVALTDHPSLDSTLTVNHSSIRDNTATVLGGGAYLQGESTFLDTKVDDNTADAQGGGIFATANLTVDASSVSGNTALRSGGVAFPGNNPVPDLQIVDSLISGNAAEEEGGGIAIGVANSEIIDTVIQENSAGDEGGGLVVTNALSSTSISSSSIINNTAGSSGGGMDTRGPIEITATQVVGNTAGEDGGGAELDDAVTITDSVFSDNNAGADGGGIDTDDRVTQNAEVTIARTTISGNTAVTHAGGIDNDGTMTITDSTISDNNAGTDGGGIENDESITLVNSTVSGNTAGNEGGGIWMGEPDDTIEIAFSTIANNTANGGGAGAQAIGGGIHMTVSDASIQASIVAGNLPSNCGASPVDSLGDNVVSDGTCGLGEPGDQPATDPLLGDLADNGGPTETHAIAQNSPAVDAVTAVCPPPAVDQRGTARPKGDACDAGSLELVPGTPATWGDDDCNGAVAATDALKNLQEIAAIPYTQTDPCFALGEPVGVTPAGFGAYPWGDVDCNGALASTDALAILRSLAALPVNQQPNCPEIGDAVLIQP